jgi:hypothetical protein
MRRTCEPRPWDTCVIPDPGLGSRQAGLRVEARSFGGSATPARER